MGDLWSRLRRQLWNRSAAYIGHFNGETMTVPHIKLSFRLRNRPGPAAHWLEQ